MACKKKPGKKIMEKEQPKIEIKKSHEGRFTKYCDGKVTNECIEEGLASHSTKINKMAQLAKNAREFKH